MSPIKLPPINCFDDLMARAGTTQRLATALKVHPYTISQWEDFGIPNKYWSYLINKYNVTPAELYSINQKAKKAVRVKNA